MRYSMINCLILSFLSIETLYSQVEIVSVYPTQNYLTAPRETDLYAVFNLDLDESTVVDTNIVVFAERTGTHFGNLSYDAGSRTLTFDPDNDFIAGERVRVTLTNKIKGASGESFRGFTWHFTMRAFGSKDFDFVPRGELPAGISFYLAVFDFNNDGYPDIVTKERYFDIVTHFFLNDRSGGFFHYNSIINTIPFGGSPLGEVLDVQPDGWTDLYFSISHLFLLNQGNKMFKETQIDSLSLVGLGGFGGLADLDNNGEMDLVVSGSDVNDSIYVYRGWDGNRFLLEWKESVPIINLTNPNEELFDMNNDGLLDIICSVWDSTKVGVLINQGDWEFEYNEYDTKVTSSSYLVYTNDMDSDGDLDFVCFGHNYTQSPGYFLLSNNGDGTFGFADYQPPRHEETLTGGDLDGDGDIDLVADSTFGGVEGHMYILRNDGHNNFTPMKDYIVGKELEQVALVDYDLDGDLDIVGIREDDFFIFWMENTSILSVDEKDNRVTIDDFYLYQNYPNPFNATTTISYQLPASSHVNLKIYDINGREVITLVNNTEDAGKHQVRWNGVDSRGKEVSSGIYFIHIRAERFLQTRKMILLR